MNGKFSVDRKFSSSEVHFAFEYFVELHDEEIRNVSSFMKQFPEAQTINAEVYAGRGLFFDSNSTIPLKDYIVNGFSYSEKKNEFLDGVDKFKSAYKRYIDYQSKNPFKE